MQDELRKYRMPIFGFALACIYLRHLLHIGNYSFGILDPVFVIGDIGVDIFLFLSGYGLAFSYNKHTVIDFYKRRVLRVLPTVITLLVVFVFVDAINERDFNCLRKLFSLKYYIYSCCTNYWFVFAIIFLYTIFPFLRVCVKSNVYISLMGAYLLSLSLIVLIIDVHFPLFSDPSLTIGRLPVFVFGISCALTPEILEKRKIAVIIMILCIPLLYLGISKEVQRIIYSFLVLGIINILLFFFSRNKWIVLPLLKLGELSLEFYLIHIYLMWNQNLFSIDNIIHSHFLVSIIILVISIAASLLVHKVLNLAFRR